MTDGIIQKVIYDWFSKQVFPNGVLSHELTWTNIQQLQQELIEKIKLSAFCPDLVFGNIIQLKELIGDNKE